MVKKGVPKETKDNLILYKSDRDYPSLDCLAKEEHEELEERVRRLMKFEDEARTPGRVVDKAKELLISKGFAQKDFREVDEENDERYFFVDPWVEESMIIVKEGRRPLTDGFRLLLAHGDVPCLRLKPRSIKIKWDEDERYYDLGVRLSAVPHGGISTHQWVGQQIKILGCAYLGDEKINIELPGVIGDCSAHIDYREDELLKDAFPPENSLEIIPGYSKVKELLGRLELKTVEDFSLTRLFAVPTNPPLPIDEYTWRLLVAYGHDDRAPTFSSIDAIAKATDNDYTSIVWVTNNEESGEAPPTGAEGPFLDLVLDNLLDRQSAITEMEITERDRRMMLYNSSAIVADVTISPVGHDSDDMDYASAAKIGLGVSIATDIGEITSQKFTNKLKQMARSQFKGKGAICCQLTGDFYHQDKEGLWCYGATKEGILSKMGQVSWVGIPCGSAHSHNEIICPGDEIWTYRLYRRFLEYPELKE